MSDDRNVEIGDANGDDQADMVDPGLGKAATSVDIESRNNSIQLIVDRIIPVSTFPQRLQAFAVRNGKTADQITVQDRRDRSQELGGINRKGFVNLISGKELLADDDIEEFVYTVYKTAKLLVKDDEAPDQEVQAVAMVALSVGQAHLFHEFAENWKNRFLTGSGNESYSHRRAFKEVLKVISGQPESDPAAPRDPDIARQLFSTFIEGYDYSHTFSDNSVRSFVGNRMRDIIYDTNNPDDLKNFLRIIRETPSTSREAFHDFIDGITRYAGNHGLSDVAVQGLVSKLFPAIEKKESQVDVLTTADTVIFVPEKGKFGLADFVCHAYTLPVNPSTINELQMIARELPTTLVSRLEENRNGVLALRDSFGILRVPVHDQRPYIHEWVSGMIKFYETGDDGPLRSVLAKVEPRYLENEAEKAAIFDRDRYNYEHIIDNEPVKAIDILRRIAENTQSFVDEKPPETSDPELNRLLQGLDGEDVPTHETLKESLDYVNTDLAEMMKRGEIGIEPNRILAYAWLERKGFHALQKLNFEQQVDTYKQEWFHSILRFHELTASPSDFSEEEFQQFLNGLTSSGSAEVAYRSIFDRTMDHVGKFADKYKSMGMDSMVGALWSGNITHELIGLHDPREGETTVGKRLSEEAKRSPQERLKGD